MSDDIRHDRHLGTVVHVVAERQNRPNRPSTDCPFCIGGLEAPLPYDVFAFQNRWPALGDGKCEVVLYTPEHDSSIPRLGASHVRKVVDVWAERTEVLRRSPDVDFVLVFENRGASVGATIDHPHSQIYAFDHVPNRQSAIWNAGWTPDTEPSDRLVAHHGSWSAWVHHAPVFPVSIILAPVDRTPDLASLDDRSRDDLSHLLVDVLGRCDTMFGAAMPYMMWFNQAPTSQRSAWLHAEIVSPWRATGVHRYIAAAEVSTGEYFNPVKPEDLAARLNALRT
jgi:UDPglucose--hexose-1-phosphate uridylyltransferase